MEVHTHHSYDRPIIPIPLLGFTSALVEKKKNAIAYKSGSCCPTDHKIKDSGIWQRTYGYQMVRGKPNREVERERASKCGFSFTTWSNHGRKITVVNKEELT